MRSMKRVLVAMVLVAVAGVTARATEEKAKGSGAFEKLKALAGEWRTQTPDGTAHKVSYRLVSSGTAVMEELEYGGMITVYHQDGDSLVLTHYCAGGNQPRMRAKPTAGNTLEFRFQDVSNLPDPKSQHMRHMTMTIKDADHISEQWTFYNEGVETVETFELMRVK